MKASSRTTAMVGVAAVACMTLSRPATAQTTTTPTASATEPAGMQDIIVTANRREQRLQDVPVAVTALSSESLARNQVTNVDAIQRMTPSLNIRPFPGDPTHASISLRGIASNEALPTVDPAVGLYLDGVYIARAPGANLSLVDVERVEVLRGPQGTLFGRNTIGGAINIVPKRPSRVFEGEVDGSLGNYNLFSIGGVLNVPLSSGVAIRVAGQHLQHSGYAESLVSGRDLNDQNSDFIRAQLSVDLATDWNVLIGGDYSHVSNHGQWVTLVSAGTAAINYVNLVSGGKDSVLNYVDP